MVERKKRTANVLWEEVRSEKRKNVKIYLRSSLK